MEPLGEITKTMLLKHESHKLHQEFEVDALKATITFSADLVISNTINGRVNGVAIAQVTFSTDHDTTMDLIVAALEALDAVDSCVLTDASNNRQITVYAADQESVFFLSDWVVAAGGSQATVTLAHDTNDVHLGQPVVLTSDGKLEPATSSHTKGAVIGISMHTSIGGEMATVEMKAMAIVFMECATDSLNAGPVKLHANGRNSSTGYMEVDDASVDHTNQIGWALDSGDDGDVIRVAIAV